MDIFPLHCVLPYAFDAMLEPSFERLYAELEQEPLKNPEKFLLCSQCGQPITCEKDRIEIGGSHSHGFTNPHGIRFDIGCFREASGCLEFGLPTLEFTWFPGYAWRITCCKSCQQHLGWAYYSHDHDRFYGLILHRLSYPQ
jgi:hypothetical protein